MSRKARNNRKLLKRALAEESALVAADSMELLETFERLEDDNRRLIARLGVISRRSQTRLASNLRILFT